MVHACQTLHSLLFIVYVFNVCLASLTKGISTSISVLYVSIQILALCSCMGIHEAYPMSVCIQCNAMYGHALLTTHALVTEDALLLERCVCVCVCVWGGGALSKNGFITIIPA